MTNPLSIYQCEDPQEAFLALVDEIRRTIPLRSARWRDADGHLRGAWSDDGEGPGPAASVVSLPLPSGGEIELLPEGDLGDGGRSALEEGMLAFDRMVSLHDRLAAAERERDELRRRAEESEALNLLGLAANRTLDPDEVLTVVARLTRTLLGAHYVTVNTITGEEVRTVAAVGLRAQRDAGPDALAARVIRTGRPLVIDSGNAPDPALDLASHREEGMQSVLGVPLSLFGETFGALVIGYRRPYHFEGRDSRLGLTLASHAAVAISNARLHRTLAERSSELERAYEELRWSSEAKERFFASMSHELRTPLNAILGYQSLILDGVPGEVGPGVRSFLEKAHRATQSLLLLVNDVLDLSKLAAGKMELLLLPVRLTEVVEDAVSTVRPMAQERHLPVQVHLPDSVPLITTDADRVRQILVNLLSNSVKFTSSGQVAISLRIPETADGVPPRWVEIQVSDTGPGIAPENLERIFHEFEQVSDVAARGGTGLGLPISRKLARLLGGDITVTSEPGAGSVFTLRLPGEPGED